MANALGPSGSPPYNFYADFLEAKFSAPQWEARGDMRYCNFCLRTFYYGSTPKAHRIVVVDSSDSGTFDVWEIERRPPVRVETGNLIDPDTQLYLKYVENSRQRIRSWPPQTQTRIFMIDAAEDGLFWDLFGLEFQLDPWFLMNAINTAWGVANRSYPYRRGSIRKVSSLKPRPEPLDLECGRVAMLLSKDSGIYPINIVLLILPSQKVPSHEQVYDILHLTGVSDPSRVIFESLLSEDRYSTPTNYIQINVVQYFLDMIEKWSDQESLEAGQDPIRFLVPLVELQLVTTIVKAYEFKDEFVQQRELRDIEHEPYKKIWRPLRDEIEASSRLERNLKGLQSSVAGQNIQQDSKVEACLMELSNILGEARQIEQHIQDELQLQVGQLSLKESRKSIEQSNVSIAEGKRVKLRM